MTFSRPTHALFVYGSWLRARRLSVPASFVSRADGTEIEEVALEQELGDAEEVWGLLRNTTIEAVQASEHGHITKTSLTPAPGAGLPSIDWTASDFLLVIQRSSNCWAEWLGDTPVAVELVTWETMELDLPEPFGRQHVLVPSVDGSPLTFLAPLASGNFEQVTTWFVQDARGNRGGGVYEECSEIIPLPSEYDALKDEFNRRLAQLFHLLAAEGIFGCDAYGGGWAASEGWDIVADRVTPEICDKNGWKSPADYRLVWCDTFRQEEYFREEVAEARYSANGMNEDWWDRVDRRRQPLGAPIVSTGFYFGGPSEAERERIGAALVRNAPAVGLVAKWDGSPDRIVEVQLA